MTEEPIRRSRLQGQREARVTEGRTVASPPAKHATPLKKLHLRRLI